MLRMKTFVNKTFFAVVATVLVAGTAFFASCEKEENMKTQIRDVGTQSIKSSMTNPYNFVGELHNEGLNYIVQNCDFMNLTDTTIYDAVNSFVKERFGISSDVKYEDITEMNLVVPDNVASLLLGEKSAISFIQKEELAIVMDSVIAILRTMLEENKLMNPNEFSEKIMLLENVVLKMECHNPTPTITSVVNEYDAILSALAIYKYSYSYWYEVANNENHLWNLFSSKSLRTKKPCEFLEKVGNFFKEAAEVVIKVVATVPYDAWSGLYNSGKRNTLSVDIKKAINGSADMWNDDWW